MICHPQGCHCLHWAGMEPSRAWISAVTSVAVRIARPPTHPGQGPVYRPAVAVAALIRSFIGQGHSGSVVTWPLTHRLQRFAPAPVVVHGLATAARDVPVDHPLLPVPMFPEPPPSMSPLVPRTEVTLKALRSVVPLSSTMPRMLLNRRCDG